MKPSARTKLIFCYILLVSLAAFSQMGLFILHQFGEFKIPLNVVQLCLNSPSVAELGHKLLHYASLLVIGYTIARMTWCIIKQIALTRKWIHLFVSSKHVKSTKRLNDQYQEWNTEIIVIENPEFVALTIGIWRPRVIISTGLLHMFTRKEIQVIVLHEMYHCRNQDQLKMFLTNLLLCGLSYIPILTTLVRDFKTNKELLADRFAIKQMGTEYYLGTTLLKICKMKKFPVHSAVGVYFAETAIDYRILQVLEPDREEYVPYSYRNQIFISAFILLSIGFIAAAGC